ncbi:hypothetical protein ACFLVM_03545, partial [Chloroflexota bacterium]
ETTARDGFMKDYYIVFLKDGTGTFSEEMHDNVLKTIDLFVRGGGWWTQMTFYAVGGMPTK